MDQRMLMMRAKEIALKQGRLAPSPGMRSMDGSVTLCAASCIAKAAIEQSEATLAVADFEARVVSEAKDTYVPGVFEILGLTSELAKWWMVENDRRDPTTRLAWFTELEC